MKHPFGVNMGWKTVTGWLVFCLGAIGYVFGELVVVQAVQREVWIAVILSGRAFAGYGQRDAAAKQMILQQQLIGVMSAAGRTAAVRKRKK